MGFTLSAQTDSTRVLHRVELGENLFRISLKYNVKLDQLRLWNQLASYDIKAGQQLVVGYQKVVVPQPTEQKAAAKRTPDYIATLQKIVGQVEDLYYESLAVESRRRSKSDTISVKRLFQGKHAENLQYERLNELNDALIQSLKDDIGLGFYSSYTHNFRPGIFDGEDLFFRNRGNVGLDWNLLRQGLAGNKDDIKKLQIDQQVNELLRVKDTKNENYVYLYNYIIYLFNQSQQGYLDRRLSVIDDFLEVASRMYLVRAMPWEQIIRLKSQKEALENMSKNLTNYNRGFDSAYTELDFDRMLDVEQLPVLEILPEKVFSGPAFDTLNQRLLNLERQKLEVDYKRTKDLNLRTYLRYNVFDSENSNLRSFGSVGATFTAPLFRNKRNEELKQKRLAVMESQLDNEVTAVNNELMNHYYEYEYTLKQYIEFYGKKELALEKLRREITRDYLNDPRFTPLDAINYIDELYAIDFDLLDLKQKLYLKLLKIYSLLDVEDISEFTTPLEFSNFFDKMAGNRAVYVWSDGFQQFEPEFLQKYISNNDFDRVFLSPGTTPEADVLVFLERAHQQGLKVYRLIGENSYAQTNDFSSLTTKVQQALALGYDGIQLDIEPHTFDDWRGNQDAYLANLNNVIRAVASNVTLDKALSVSFPLFYPKEFYQNLSAEVDEIVLMCYERPDVSFVVNQIADEVSLMNGKLSLAIRTQDFNDRIVLEDFVKELINATGINELVIHDLGSLISLDQKTILAK